MSSTDQVLEKVKTGSSDAGSPKRGSKNGKKMSSGNTQLGLPKTTNLEEMKNEQLFLLEVLVNSIEVCELICYFIGYIITIRYWFEQISVAYFYPSVTYINPSMDNNYFESEIARKS